MAGIERAEELNEIGWWSHWARLSWPAKDCYSLRSREFDEPLFNHAGFLTAKPWPDRLLHEIEKKYRARGAPAAFFLQRLPAYAPTRRILLRHGFKIVDRFLVLQLAKDFRDPVPEIKCRIAGPADLDDWCRTYLLSFYGDLSLLRHVRRSVTSALRDKRTELILAQEGNLSVGALAIYTRREISGVYCVGTLPEQRGRGIATGMLYRAHEISRGRRTRLFLQTFLSDSAENFYFKRGFKLFYSKDVLSKK